MGGQRSRGGRLVGAQVVFQQSELRRDTPVIKPYFSFTLQIWRELYFLVQTMHSHANLFWGKMGERPSSE